MKRYITIFLAAFISTAAIHSAEQVHDQHANPSGKPSPEEALKMLKEGNERFYKGETTHPHITAERLKQAGSENQGDHAYATIITCSDSRVPVEILFDAGIMDIFVIRVAGNVCDTDEIGSIEYGLAHVNTPVFVMLGHTQCGAVTAVTHEVQGHGHKLEKNIPPLVDNIIPSVKKAIHKHPAAKGDHVIPYAIEENVWQGIYDLLKNSPASLKLVVDGKVKVVGAIYDVGTGEINWLPEEPVEEIIRSLTHKKVSKKTKKKSDIERRFKKLRDQ